MQTGNLQLMLVPGYSIHMTNAPGRIEREIPESDYEILREPGFDAPARQAKPTTCHRPTPDLAAYGHD